MKVKDFISKWRNSINYLGCRSVGIHVGWDLIPEDSIVQTYYGVKAWEKIYGYTPPWFKKPKTFTYLVDSKDADYAQIVREETKNGRIEYYRKNGLKEPFFCAFANSDGSFVLLGDGNHGFLDCTYLMDEEGQSLEEDIERTQLDVVYLSNFDEVMKPGNIWKGWES